MPIYEFECINCGEIIEYFVTEFETETVQMMCSCGHPMSKIISKTNFKLEGSGWAKDGYSKKVGGNSEKENKN